MTELKLAAQKALEAMTELRREAVILSDNYLEAFRQWSNDASIQGWDKARWLRASAAAKKADAAAETLRSALQHQEEREPVLANVVEEIAQGWDGCRYDAVAGEIDIGSAIRAHGNNLLALATPPLLQKEEGDE